MIASILFTIWLSWTLLTILTRITRRDPAIWAAPFAGLACAGFGIFYF